MASGSKDGKTPDLPRGLIDRRGTPAGKAARLPSLRGPRDLTLGGVQRKVFVPNIPVRKEKAKEEVSKDQADGRQDSRKSRDGSSRGRGRGGGRGRGRGQDNLIQLHSLFEQGPSGQTRKAWGSSSDGGGGGDRISSAPRVKQENTKHGGDSATRSLEHLMRDDFVADGPHDDPTMLPVMLPMSAMVKAEVKKGKLQEDTAKELRIKDEPMDDTDSLSTAVTVPEKAMSVSSNSGRSTPESDDGKEISCKQLVKRAAKSEKEELVFLQLPDVLPGQPLTEMLSSGPNQKGDADSHRKESKQGEDSTEKPASCSLADFSEGYVGKLRVRKSGKAELVLGDVVLDVSMGTPCGFLQDVVSIRTEEDDQRMTVLGHMQHRMICTPNFQALLASSLNT